MASTRCTRDCGRRAVTWWALIRDEHDPRDDAELYLCGVHSDLHAEALVTQSWVNVADERDAAVVVREGDAAITGATPA